jgi:protein gp37
MTSNIEWTNETWNPVVGCSLASPGCTNCYAMKMAGRLEAMGVESYQGTTQKSKAGFVWTGKVNFNEAALLKPFKWKKPRLIFVNSMSDLFHPAVPDEVIDKVFAVAALCPQHTFQILTKRSARMREYCNDPQTPERIALIIIEQASDWSIKGEDWLKPLGNRAKEEDPSFVGWPLPNVWLGVSVEDQARADERIPDLLDTPAAVRFLSCEPLLGPINITSIAPRPSAEDLKYWPSTMPLPYPPEWGCLPWIDWIIAGGESGHGARPMHPDWARSLRD